jgi:hypothetical protein
MKICEVGTELFHAASRTGRHDETDSRFIAILRKGVKRFARRSVLTVLSRY